MTAASGGLLPLQSMSFDGATLKGFENRVLLGVADPDNLKEVPWLRHIVLEPLPAKLGPY